jgi:hypothetical protein
MREELDRPRRPPTGGARGFFLGVRALAKMGVRAPARLGVRASPAAEVRARLGVRALATMGVRAPVPLGVRRVSRLLVSSLRLRCEPRLRMCRASASAGRHCSVPLAPPCRMHQQPACRRPPAAMLAGPPKRVRAGEPTTAAAVLQACKAVCALDPVVSGKDGRVWPLQGAASHPSSGRSAPAMGAY